MTGFGIYYKILAIRSTSIYDSYGNIANAVLPVGIGVILLATILTIIFAIKFFKSHKKDLPLKFYYMCWHNSITDLDTAENIARAGIY